MKCTIKIDGWGEVPKTQRADWLIETCRARCVSNRLKLTLWLLFDIATGRNGKVRDDMLTAFRKHASRFGKPRSIAEGAKWLAHYGDDYAD